MRDLLRPAARLLIICFVVAFCLSLVNEFTKGVIESRTLTAMEEQRAKALPEAKKFEMLDAAVLAGDPTGTVREAYAAYKGKRLVGYVFSTFPKGYGGEMNVTVGISEDGKISAVILGDNNETPGLGTKVGLPAFLDQFTELAAVGKSLVIVKKPPVSDSEIKAVSGATISSKAVTAGVQAAADLAGTLLENGGTLK